MKRHIRGSVVLVSVMLGAGCGGMEGSSGDAAKPIRPGAATAGPNQPRPHVMLLLPTPNSTDAEILRETIERLAAGSRTPFIYREGFVRDGMPARMQAEVISESARKGVAAMIVAAADPDAVSSALAQARDQGVAVVLIGPEVAVEGKAPPRVSLSPAEPVARQIVDALLERVKREGAGTSSSSDTALVLTVEGQAWKLQDAATALKAALEQAKMPVAATVRHGRAAPEALTALTQALRDHPDARLVLFDSDSGAQAAQAVHDDPTTEHRFVYGGFIDRADPRALGGASALVQRNLPVVAERAVTAALALINKQPAPDREVVEPAFHMGTPASRSRALPSSGTKTTPPPPGPEKSRN
jgi:ABC-type sugar transport system substrate-binding protein